MNLIDVKLSLDQETIEWLTAGALSMKTSKSGFLRMVPTLLTPEERDFIEAFRKVLKRPEDDRNTVGSVHATED